MKKLYIIYGGRAIPWKHQPQEARDIIAEREKLGGKTNAENFRQHFFPGNTDDAAIFETCNSLAEARKAKGEYCAPGGACIYSYDIAEKDRALINEKFVEVL